MRLALCGGWYLFTCCYYKLLGSPFHLVLPFLMFLWLCLLVHSKLLLSFVPFMVMCLETCFINWCMIKEHQMSLSLREKVPQVLHQHLWNFEGDSYLNRTLPKLSGRLLQWLPWSLLETMPHNLLVLHIVDCVELSFNHVLQHFWISHRWLIFKFSSCSIFFPPYQSNDFKLRMGKINYFAFSYLWHIYVKHWYIYVFYYIVYGLSILQVAT